MCEPMTDCREMTGICIAAHTLTEEGRYEECLKVLASAMAKHPDAPEPHNLLGLMLERKGDHMAAMRHFRAAWALDPSYRPARDNLERFGGLHEDNRAAWQQADCGQKEEYQGWHFGRFVRRLVCA